MRYNIAIAKKIKNRRISTFRNPQIKGGDIHTLLIRTFKLLEGTVGHFCSYHLIVSVFLEQIFCKAWKKWPPGGILFFLLFYLYILFFHSFFGRTLLKIVSKGQGIYLALDQVPVWSRPGSGDIIILFNVNKRISCKGPEESQQFFFNHKVLSVRFIMCTH